MKKLMIRVLPVCMFLLLITIGFWLPELMFWLEGHPTMNVKVLASNVGEDGTVQLSLTLPADLRSLKTYYMRSGKNLKISNGGNLHLFSRGTYDKGYLAGSLKVVPEITKTSFVLRMTPGWGSSQQDRWKPCTFYAGEMVRIEESF